MLDPESVRARQRPVVFFQGGIHAGEIDGKDAGFIALREMLEGRESRGALSRTTVLFVPVFNVDGHERFGAWNRPNQRGPEADGVARDGAEPEPQPRLRQGRSAGNARAARAP